MKRVKIGDIVEIKTSMGLVYAQYTHKHEQYGQLLRIFRTFYTEKPSDFEGLVQERPAFLCFFPLVAAINRGILSIVANVSVPQQAQKFPIFRSGVADPATGKVGVWWLWDGQNEWRVGTLQPEQKQIPIRGVINDTLLIERIESGWTAETDPT